MAMAAAAAYPPWVILEHYCTLEVQGSSSSIADENTLASCRTTAGHPITVGLCPAAPPEGSRVCVQLPDGIEAFYAIVAAAHGDSVVVNVGEIEDTKRRTFSGRETSDDFAYSAGDAAGELPRPPSLSLLLPHHIDYGYEEGRPGPAGCDYLDPDGTGLLCCGEGDFMVAELKMESFMGKENSAHSEAWLHLLWSGSGEWYATKPAISRSTTAAGGGSGDERVDDDDDLASSWRTRVVIPVGDEMLCWVDLKRGLLFSDDVFGESPGLRYVPFPEDPNLGPRGVRAAANGTTLKVVNVLPRCCCGRAGKSYCAASNHAYVVHTWTLRMDDMTWAMDGSLDATQLWALDGHSGIPHVELDSPIVSMDEPDTIFFEVCERRHEKHGGDGTVWSVMIDMKRKTLRSVFRYPEGRRHSSWWERRLPSRVSKYFDSKPCSRQPPGPAAQQADQATQNMSSRNDNKLLHEIDNSTMQAASPEGAILAALQEIPGLDHHDMLKAYRILAHDDSGRRFRALMGLPVNFRKDCVLMEIKACEACVLCSACSADLAINRMKR